MYFGDKNEEFEVQDILSILSSYYRDICFIKGPAIIFYNIV